MEDKINVKENIINVTTKLIEESDGDVKKITARNIAERAKIGLGLINYHFQSKDNLITICVQRIINNVILGFDMSADYNNDKERLTAWAIYVFEFLYKNSAISRISILDDLKNYTENCNSVKTQKGFMFALNKDVDEKNKQLLSFILTCAMQTAFLSKGSSKSIIGYDLEIKSERSEFITNLVNMLF